MFPLRGCAGYYLGHRVLPEQLVDQVGARRGEGPRKDSSGALLGMGVWSMPWPQRKVKGCGEDSPENVGGRGEGGPGIQAVFTDPRM